MPSATDCDIIPSAESTVGLRRWDRWQLADTGDLREEGMILAHSSEGPVCYGGKAQQQERETAAPMATTVKEAENSAHLPFSSSGKPSPHICAANTQGGPSHLNYMD